jgi:hypothetical protein
MSPFEFAFSLFGLLLGLCIAEVFGGLGRAFEYRGRIALGWLTPLLGILVLNDLLSYWIYLWDERASIPVNALTLLFGTAFAGAYYLAAYVVFPRELESNSDLNNHFFRVRRMVLGISATGFYGVAMLLVVARLVPLQELVLTAVLFTPAYVTALFAKRERLVAGSIMILIVLNLVGALSDTVNFYKL